MKHEPQKKNFSKAVKGTKKPDTTAEKVCQPRPPSRPQAPDPCPGCGMG